MTTLSMYIPLIYLQEGILNILDFNTSVINDSFLPIFVVVQKLSLQPIYCLKNLTAPPHVELRQQPIQLSDAGFYFCLVNVVKWCPRGYHVLLRLKVYQRFRLSTLKHNLTFYIHPSGSLFLVNILPHLDFHQVVVISPRDLRMSYKRTVFLEILDMGRSEDCPLCISLVGVYLLLSIASMVALKRSLQSAFGRYTHLRLRFA